MPDPDNIGVEILVLSSVALISNIVLLTEYVLTSELNEKDPIFKKQPLTNNDEVDNILIGHLCVFCKTMVYCGEIIGNRCKYIWRPYNRVSSEKDFKNIRVTHLIIGRLRTTFPKLKLSIDR